MDKNIYAAFADFVAEIPSFSKDGRNPHFNSEYVTFDSIMAVIKPLALKQGLYVWHRTECEVTDGGLVIVKVTPVVSNAKGEHIEGGTMANIVTNNVQQVGSVTTYLKRYSISSLLGIAADVDDDGESNRQFVENAKDYEKAAVKNYTAKATASKPGGITADQQTEIRALIKEQALDRETFAGRMAEILPKRAGQNLTNLTKLEAQTLIDGLKATVDPFA